MIPMETLKEKKMLAHCIQKNFQETLHSEPTEIWLYIKASPSIPVRTVPSASVCVSVSEKSR